MVGGSVVQLAKEAKHQQMLLRQRLPLDRLRALRDRLYRAADRVKPYEYREGAHGGSFIAAVPKAKDAKARPAPSTIFVLWTGTNALSDNRAAALEDIQSRFEVTLVTPETMAPWVLDTAPLHPSFEDLSLVHRADYLRAYLMHHHGGTYLDIKPDYGDVEAAVARLNAAPEHWMAGFRELGADTVSDERSPVRRALRRHHGSLIATCAFASRPGTPLTEEWMAEVHRRLDRFAPELQQNPGDAYGRNEGYPVPWTGILGAVLHPLCLKYSDRLLMDENFRPSLSGYR